MVSFTMLGFLVPFIVLGGCLAEVSEVHKVDTSVEEGEFLSMLYQLVEDANHPLKERQNSHQDDQRV